MGRRAMALAVAMLVGFAVRVYAAGPAPATPEQQAGAAKLVEDVKAGIARDQRRVPADDAVPIRPVGTRALQQPAVHAGETVSRS